MRVNAQNRAFAALVSLGYLLGYLLVFVHFVAEQHATCAEHGDAHHVAAASDGESEPISGLSRLPDTVDDHCHLLNAVRHETTAATAFQVSLLRPLPDLTTLSLASALETSHVGGPVWRYAPKQSPPAHS